MCYMSAMRQRTTIRLPQDLLGRAKRKAAAEGCSLNALIEDGLRRVAYGSPEATSKRILPRVSTETGGPMPGIDITDSSALQEMDDLEYVERMKHFG
jgi:hypothetical protein